MIENIRNSFIDMLQKSTWMDSDSKTEAAAKVKHVFSNTKKKKTSLFSLRLTLSVNKLVILIISAVIITRELNRISKL